MLRVFIPLFLILSSHWSYGQVDSIRNFIFGHSLLVHEPQDTSYASNYTTVPHWVYSFAQANSQSYLVSGQYGFLPQHINFPPIAQWGFDQVPGAWESDTEPFGDADFNVVILTPANFIQDQPADMNYYNESLSPVTATSEIVSWSEEQEDEMQVYIYENWPDMAGFIAGEGFPPSPSELSNYHSFTEGDFHDWWLAYQDAVVMQRPDDQVKMIPVGPIMASLLSDASLAGIPIDDLYEDNAPHGRPTIYFLAGMITYMAIYEEVVSDDYVVPDVIHPLVTDNFRSIVTTAWDYLQEFNFPDGSSRVFAAANMTTAAADLTVDLDGITFYPNPTSGIFVVDGVTTSYDVDILDVMGNVHQILDNSNRIEINLSALPDGLYFVRLRHRTNGNIHIELILKS